MAQPYQGIFERIEFPPYVFREYPKWIDAGGTPKLVQNQREELAVMAETPEASINDPVVVEKNKLNIALYEARLREEKLAKELAELKAQRAGPTITVQQPDDPSKPVELSKSLAAAVKK